MKSFGTISKLLLISPNSITKLLMKSYSIWAACSKHLIITSTIRPILIFWILPNCPIRINSKRINYQRKKKSSSPISKTKPNQNPNSKKQNPLISHKNLPYLTQTISSTLSTKSIHQINVSNHRKTHQNLYTSNPHNHQ